MWSPLKVKFHSYTYHSDRGTVYAFLVTELKCDKDLLRFVKNNFAMALVGDLRRSFIKRTASFRKKKNLQASLKVDKITDLTEEDRDKFIEFKRRIFDDLQARHTDNVLLRFLKARSFKVDDAEKLFRLDLNFRRVLDAENIVDYVIPEVYEKYRVSGILGFDDEGSLVRVFNIGFCDLRGQMNCLPTFELVKLLIWYMELDMKAMTEENRRTGHKADKVTYILNFENITLHQIMYKPVIDNAMQGLKILQDHFYDIVKVIYVVNAPAFFSTFYSLLRPVIQEELHRMIKILPSDTWREELLKHISADVLPVYLGGKRVDSNKDPLCKSFIKFGGTIPDSYYPEPESFLDPKGLDVKTAVVQSGSYCNFRYPVFEVGTEILLHVNSKEYDIGIGVFLEPLSTYLETPSTAGQQGKRDMSKMEQLFPIVRSQCHVTPEVRKVVAWKTGVYVLHFDNTYSWMNAKHVHFKVKITLPEMKEIIL